MNEVAVIGSGPAGASAAWALVSKGYRVVLVDVGFEIEQDARHLIEGSSSVDYAELSRQIKERRNLIPRVAGTLPEKLPFGSDFVYRGFPETSFKLTPPTTVLTSLALGGLSNVWGANVNAVANQDLSGWPFDAGELAPYYPKLNEFVEVASDDDILDSLYDFRIGTPPSYALGLQGQVILERVRKNSEKLKDAGIYTGRAKIAVGKMYSADYKGCISCGCCMHGCPHNAIFNAGSVISRLGKNPNFKYCPGVLINSFVESESSVHLLGRDIRTNDAWSRDFAKIFVAAGVINSTALVARSLSWCDQVFKIKDSQKWYFPFLCSERVHGALTDKANTLAQIFLQMPNLKSTSRIVHSQLYGFNDLLIESLQNSLGPLANILVKYGAPILERVMIGMVYLHSDDSGSLYFKVNPNTEANISLGEIRGDSSPRATLVYKEFMELLTANRKMLGGIPFPMFAKRGMPGRSQHFGGTIPMQKEHKQRATDLLGRPYGCSRVHVVDSSVFPSIPGTPTTYTVMANAIRIAEQAVK